MSIHITSPTFIHVKGVAYILTDLDSVDKTARLQVWDSPDQVEGADRELTLYIDDPLPEDGYTVKADGSVYLKRVTGEINWVADLHILDPNIDIYYGNVTDILK